MLEVTFYIVRPVHTVLLNSNPMMKSAKVKCLLNTFIMGEIQIDGHHVWQRNVYLYIIRDKSN